MKNAFWRDDKNNRGLWWACVVGGFINHASQKDWIGTSVSTQISLVYDLSPHSDDRWSNSVDGFTNCFVPLSGFLWFRWWRRWESNILISIIYAVSCWHRNESDHLLRRHRKWMNPVGWKCKRIFFCFTCLRGISVAWVYSSIFQFIH